LSISRYERSECSQSTKDKRFSELSLSSVTGLFYIFLFGVILSCVIAFTEFLITAKAESEKLNIDFREILRIKMIEYVYRPLNESINVINKYISHRNLVGITIHAQHQLEFGRGESVCINPYQNEQSEQRQDHTKYELCQPQTDV
jgi:hypothetical protein